MHCFDAGFDCPAIVNAEIQEEILNIASQHAQTVHGVTIAPEMAEQIKTLIKNEKKVAKTYWRLNSRLSH